MNNLDKLSKMYYIMDGCGNYYRVNGKDQLVAASNRDEAGVFGFIEANHRIGGGRKSHFYAAIPVDEYEDEPDIEKQQEAGKLKEQTQQGAEEQSKRQAEFEAEEQSKRQAEYEAEEQSKRQAEFEAEEQLSVQTANLQLPYDMKHINWNEYLTHFCYIASGIQNYRDELNQALSDVDMQVCDIMHYIELYDLGIEDSIRMTQLLKECREQRRDIKDEMFRIECFQKAIGTSSNIAKAKDSIKLMNRLNTRYYHPRKLKELFLNCPAETNRPSKLMRVFGHDTCIDIEKTYGEMDEVSYETSCEADIEEEEGVIMEYTKQKTVFDDRDNQWLQFAKQQAEFYANAEQYIFNLQADIDELESEIEQTLCQIENANYNVAQGYKVFKILKELRNEKKEKLKELDSLYILTERFDCKAMTEVLDECVDELKAVYEEPPIEETESEIEMAG